MPYKDENLFEPLLLEVPCKKHQHLKGPKDSASKYQQRIRHCHSAPAEAQSDPKEKVAKPSFGNHDDRSTLLKAALVLAIYLGVGLICFFTMESELEGDRTNGLVDAIYFCIVTMTTVGYGDLVPAGVAAKLFTCVFVFVGFGLVGFLLSSAANFLVEKQETMLVTALYRKQNPEYEEFSHSHQINKIRWKVVISGAIVLVLFIIGIVFLVTVEGMNLLEAFYCVCVTVTTLGYGDVSFHTTGGRIFAVIWILMSTISVAQFFLYIAEMQTEGRRQSLLHWVLTRKTTFSDLEAADLDNDGAVSAAEFVVYKLKEMGKIEEQDVVQILKEFDTLDVDNSGTISRSDLYLAQIAED